jgi:PAS domain S-box-containing protein
LTQPSIDLEPFSPFVIQPARHRRAIAERDSRGARHNEALHENDRRFRELLDALPAAVYTTDADGRITFFNEAAAELWGHRPELGRSEWCGSWRLRWPDGTPMRHDECPMAVTLREGRSVTGEAIAERPDGTRIPFAAYPKPLRDASGRLTGAVNTLVDITHRKAHEERQRLLINELNHRVKNTLATVQSIAVQSFRDVAEDHLEWFQGRLVALSNAYDVLTRENWESATIRELLATVLAPLSGPDSARFITSGPDLRLSPRAVLSLSMALHELCTNAAKYGALSNDTGQVRVQWSLSGTNGSSRLRLRWEEAGGPPVAPPQKRGFGSRLITRGVAHELSAEVRLEFPVTGVVCEIDAPLA